VTDDSFGSGLDERFLRALDSILDLVVFERAVRDDTGAIVDFVIVWMNDSPVDVAGRRRDELIGRRISELYPALAGGELIASYKHVVDTGEPMIIDVMPYEDVIDGNAVSGFYTVQASKFEDGVLVASRDVTSLETSRRDLQATLHRLEETLQELEAAQRLARLGTWRIDLATGEMTMSTELQRIYGASVAGGSADERFDRMTDRIHPEDVRMARSAFERAVLTGRPVVVEHRVVDVAGGIGHVRSYAQPVVEDGRVRALWGTTQDITEAVASRDAFAFEHSLRLTAETLAAFGARLGAARDRQDVADAAHAALSGTGVMTFAILTLRGPDDDVAHSYFGGPGLAPDLEARYRRTAMTVDTPVTRALLTGRPVLLEDRAALAAMFPSLASGDGEAKTQGLAVVPFAAADGEVLGSFAVGWRTPRAVDAPLLAMLEEIGALAARTLQRLDLLALERSIAETLQLSLLALDVRSPDVLVRARYRAAEASMQVGGDWYDAVELGDGRLAIAVGDVVGRGLPAATTMGQLRAALGVAAQQATDAADAIKILDRYSEHVPGAVCATVAFGLVDPARHTMTYVTAGHPPPLLVHPDGDSQFLEDAISWPLGVDQHAARRAAAEVAVPAGTLVIFYTDGLVERRSVPMEQGLDRLREVVTRCATLPLRLVKRAIFAELVGDDATDDIALVAFRMAGSTPRVFADVLHARAVELAPARRRLRAWLEQAGVTGEPVEDILLAVGEAVANAVEHGSTDASQVVRVEGSAGADELVISVSDSGEWQPGLEGFFTGRGRGHALMSAMADGIEVDGDHNGTIVTLRFSRARQFA
jgi:anti-sigma regulatory factor (Ser/Thr protein kinase)/PAS domain-containing protein